MNGTTTNHAADVAVDESAGGRVVDGVRIPIKATHWGCQRERPDGQKAERLSFGTTEAGAARVEWPIAEFSVAAIRDRWGAGAYRATWVEWTPDNRPHRYGKSAPIVIPEAPPVVAPPAPRTCGACGEPIVHARARVCAVCLAPLDGAPPAARAVPAAATMGGAEALSVFTQGFQTCIEMMRVAQSVANQESAERIARIRADQESEVARIRARAEADEAERRRAHERALAGGGEGGGVVESVRGLFDELRDELAELRDDVEARDEAAAESVQRAAATIKVVTGVAKEVLPVAGPILAGIAQRLASGGGGAPGGGGGAAGGGGG